MSRRVRSAAAALFALILVLQTPIAFAAPRERDRAFEPGIRQKIVKALKKVFKPIKAVTTDDDGVYMPTPPRP